MPFSKRQIYTISQPHNFFRFYTVNGVQNICYNSAAADSSTGTQRRVHVFAQKRFCDCINNERDPLDAIDCVKSKETVLLVRFVALKKACGRNVNIELIKRIFFLVLICICSYC